MEAEVEWAGQGTEQEGGRKEGVGWREVYK